MLGAVLLRPASRPFGRATVLMALIVAVLLTLAPSLGAVAAPAPPASHASSSAGAAPHSGTAALHELPHGCSVDCLEMCTTVADGCAPRSGPQVLSGRASDPPAVVVELRLPGAGGSTARPRPVEGASLTMLGVDRR